MNNKINEKEELIQAIEKMNIEYMNIKNSKEYLNGKRIDTTINLLKKFKIYTILKDLLKLRKVNKTLKNGKKENDLNIKGKTFKIHNDSNEKIVIYSCITGKYDNIQDPFIIQDNVNYVLYTDNKDIKSDIWEIRNIPENIKKFKNPILINRYIKMHPKELFCEYDYSFYIDGNVKIMSEITSLISKINQKYGLALHKHRARDCAYDEINTCIFLKRGNVKQLEKAKSIFEESKFPTKYGLLECNLILTDLKNKKANEILDLWWKEFLNSDCYRDQIFFPYVLWKNCISIDNIATLGNNIYKNGKLRIENHN